LDQGVVIGDVDDGQLTGGLRDLRFGHVEALTQQGHAHVLHARLQQRTVGDGDRSVDDAAIIELGQRRLELQEFAVLGRKLAQDLVGAVAGCELHQHLRFVDLARCHGPELGDLRRRDAAAIGVLRVADRGGGKRGLERRELDRVSAGGGDVEFGRQIVRGAEAFELGLPEYVDDLLGAGGEGDLAVRGLGQPQRFEVAGAVEIVELLGLEVGTGIAIG
jgi:hypothetical protein